MLRRIGLGTFAVLLLALGAVRADDLNPPEGYHPLFNGKDLAGWKVQEGGKREAWGAENGVLYTSGSGGAWLLTEKEYGDFELILEFKVPENGNSGVALRTPAKGDPAYVGMEIQVLDDDGSAYKTLKPTQYTGSIYDVVGAKRGSVRPAGEWNLMKIVCKGRHVTVEVNGFTIVDANLDDHKDRVDKHPGLAREAGFLGLQSHGSRVEFRRIFVRPL
jgi:3-keto-disaccharide hydrolase